ncbi:MAG: gas vesicle protein, partial [Actinobacteria bacterium]|nr:gas vesicle protein [Actinomycetota bacterium]
MADKPGGTQDDRSRMSGREVIEHARGQLEEMMGRAVEAVLGMQRDGEGWLVTV